MIFSDDVPSSSLEALIAMEGDTDDSVALLPFHRSLFIQLLELVRANPDAFFSDADTMTQEEFTDMIDNIQSRLAF